MQESDESFRVPRQFIHVAMNAHIDGVVTWPEVALWKPGSPEYDVAAFRRDWTALKQRVDTILSVLDGAAPAPPRPGRAGARPLRGRVVH